MGYTYKLALTPPHYGEKEYEERIARDNIEKIVARREEIIRGYEIRRPPDAMAFSRAKAQQKLRDMHAEAGIPVNSIPDQVFIPLRYKDKLIDDLAKYGGVMDVKDLLGISGVFNGVSVVFMDPRITKWDYSEIIFHEMFHSIGEQVMQANKNTIRQRRQGYELFGDKEENTITSWLLEEGIVAYEATKFKHELAQDKRFRGNFKNWKAAVAALDQRGYMVNNRLKLPSGMEIEPEYFWTGTSIFTVKTLNLSGAGVYGSLMGTIIDKFPEKSQKSFRELLHAARYNLELLPHLINVMDTRMGQGFYSKLSKCERTEEAVWELIKEYR